MKLHHIAFWTTDIERLIAFYQNYFEGEILFRHHDSDFSCVFVKICNEVILEIMTRSDLQKSVMEGMSGYSHFSFEVKSRNEVDRLTEFFIKNDVSLQKIKEQYDDGFYESSVLDPDGNIIEIAYIDRIINQYV